MLALATMLLVTLCAGTGSAMAAEWPKGAGERSDFTFLRWAYTDRGQIAVNVANGNLLVHSTDAVLPGVNGMDVVVDRYYNSLLPAGSRGSLGQGATTTTGFDTRLSKLAGGSVNLYVGDGSVYTFEPDGAGGYVTPPSINAVLSETADGGFKLDFDQKPRIWTFAADSGSSTSFRLARFEDRNGNGVTFHRGADGTTDYVTDSRGRRIELTWTAAADPTLQSMSDAIGRSWSWSVTGGEMAAYGNPDAKTEGFGWTSGRITRVTDRRGTNITIAYDSAGRVASLTRPTAVGQPDSVWRFRYNDPSGHACSVGSGSTVVEDPRNSARTTTYCWNAGGQVLESWDPSGNKRSGEFTPNGDAKTLTSPRGGATGAGVSTTFAYNADNALRSVASPMSATRTLSTTLAYDHAGGPLEGKRFGRFLPSSVTTPRSEAEQGAHDTRLSYDAAGNVTGVADSSSPTNRVSLSYGGPGGQVDSSTDPNGNVSRYTYTTDKELAKIQRPLGPGGEVLIGDTTLTYDGVSRIKTVTDGKGQTRTYTYDGDDHVTRVALSTGTAYDRAYDNNGNRTSEAGPKKNVTMTYDLANRMVSHNAGGLVKFTYDSADNLSTLVDTQTPSGTITYTHGPTSQLETLTEYGGAPPFAFGINADDERVRSDLPNGLRVCSDHDLSGRLTRLRTFAKSAGSCDAPPSSGLLQDYELDYTVGATDPQESGQLQRLQDHLTGRSTSYSYDLLDRLTRAETTGADPTDFRYEYDAASNRKKQTATVAGTTTTTFYAYNAVNQLCRFGTTDAGCPATGGGTGQPSYDRNGNQLTDGAGRTLQHNILDQLVMHDDTSGPDAGRVDHAGVDQRLLSYLGPWPVTDTPLGVTRMNSFGYTRDSDGNLLARRGVTGSWTSNKYVLTDPFGSVAKYTTNTGAQSNPSQKEFRYEPYGVALGATAHIDGGSAYPAYRGAFTLAGGMTHFGHRYYDPVTAQWTQPDPLDQPGDIRQAALYGYVGGDPINLSDRAGTHILSGIVRRGREILKGRDECVSVTLGFQLLGATGFAAGPLAGATGVAAGTVAGVSYCAIRTLDKL